MPVGDRRQGIKREGRQSLRPVVRFINSLERAKGERLFVLVPEMVPTSSLTGLLHNRMGTLLAAALRRRTEIVIGMVPMHLEEEPLVGEEGRMIRFLTLGHDAAIVRCVSGTRVRPAPFGAVAQLGERLNGIQEVRGSTPLGSTKFKPAL